MKIRSHHGRSWWMKMQKTDRMGIISPFPFAGVFTYGHTLPVCRSSCPLSHLPGINHHCILVDSTPVFPYLPFPSFLFPFPYARDMVDIVLRDRPVIKPVNVFVALKGQAVLFSTRSLQSEKRLAKGWLFRLPVARSVLSSSRLANVRFSSRIISGNNSGPQQTKKI